MESSWQKLYILFPIYLYAIYLHEYNYLKNCLHIPFTKQIKMFCLYMLSTLFYVQMFHSLIQILYFIVILWQIVTFLWITEKTECKYVQLVHTLSTYRGAMQFIASVKRSWDNRTKIIVRDRVLWKTDTIFVIGNSTINITLDCVLLTSCWKAKVFIQNYKLKGNFINNSIWQCNIIMHTYLFTYVQNITWINNQ
jgi:hypothetical protein